MNINPSIKTWDLLRELGFQPDSGVLSDFDPGLSFDFGNFKLSAISVLNMGFRQVVMLSGVMVSKCTLGEVAFDMPTHVSSKELCAAWIVWNLDRAADHDVFKPAHEVSWLAMGRQNQHLLPWEIEREQARRNHEIFMARPRCDVSREWLRLGLRTLQNMLADRPDDDTVHVQFDGRILTVICNGKEIVMSATGNPWPSGCDVRVGNLRDLPKRLMRDPVDVSIWKSCLRVDRYSFPIIGDVTSQPTLGLQP